MPYPVNLSAIPHNKGSYVLFFHLHKTQPICVGRLGEHTLRAGWYAYAGSAHGPGGLRARVLRHARTGKRQHWHIDAVSAAAPISAVFYSTDPGRLECTWAQDLLSLDGSNCPVSGFGASDCRCLTHFIHLPEPDIHALARQFRALAICEAGF